MRRMDVLANNLANMNSAGFKAQRLLQESHAVTSRGGETSFGDTLNFVNDTATFRDFAEGPLQSTGNPLDLAVRGDGWFEVQTNAGPRYTRNGHFTLDAQGRLVTQHGHAVTGDGGQEIVFGANTRDIIVARDGTISTKAGTVGRLRVVAFDEPQRLTTADGGLMASEAPPFDVLAPNVVQGVVEGANVEPIHEITKLIDVQRAYESTTRLIEREDGRIRKMIEEYAR